MSICSHQFPFDFGRRKAERSPTAKFQIGAFPPNQRILVESGFKVVLHFHLFQFGHRHFGRVRLRGARVGGQTDAFVKAFVGSADFAEYESAVGQDGIFGIVFERTLFHKVPFGDDGVTISTIERGAFQLFGDHVTRKDLKLIRWIGGN